MISAQIRYAIAAAPKEQSARIAQITLTTVASMLKYAAIPAQTPQITLLSLDLKSFFIVISPYLSKNI